MRAIKLLFLMLTAIIVIAATGLFSQKPCFEGASSYVFYCGTSSADCKIVRSDNPAAELIVLKNVCGESADYDVFSLDGFLKSVNAQTLFIEEIDGAVNYYCKADLPYSVKLYGEEINLHVCVRGDKARVGSPIIFGGY